MIKCPVCGQYEFEEEDDFDICDVCGWENDDLQLEEPDYEGGANSISLNQAREVWKQTGDRRAEKIANRRKHRGLPIFDENGKVILIEPGKETGE